jgi:colicin import membrane protein
VPKSVKRRPNPEGTPPDTYMYNGYEILESELVECSPVTIPANPLALAKSAAHGDVLARETIEEILDTWVKTEAGLIMPREEFEKAHKEAAGQRTTVVVPEEKTTAGLLEKILNAVTGKDVAEAQRVQAEQAAAAAAAEAEAAALEARKARAKEVADALERRLKAKERFDALNERVAKSSA